MKILYRDHKVALMKEEAMYDSFSEGEVFYGRTLLLLLGSVVLAVIAQVL